MIQDEILNASRSSISGNDNELELVVSSVHTFPTDENNIDEITDELGIYGLELLEEQKINDSNTFQEGELYVNLDLTKNNVVIDKNGDLLIMGENSQKFSLNENGELIYTY